jgi:hypothetical protein
MPPHLPCIAWQHALSSRLIGLSDMQANNGAAVKSRMKIAKILAKRRMLVPVYPSAKRTDIGLNNEAA